MILISEYQYFPSVYLYSILSLYKYVRFESFENFQKGGFRTRCRVIGPGGIQEMRIPVTGGREQRELTTRVKTDNRSPWQRSHFRTLVSCYRRSPFFEFYEPGLRDLYEQEVDYLVDWNLECFNWSLKMLNLEVEVGTTGTYEPRYPAEEFLDVRGMARSKSNLLPGVRNVPYEQVFRDRNGFIPGLSVLDLLFCAGPSALNILRETAG